MKLPNKTKNIHCIRLCLFLIGLILVVPVAYSQDEGRVITGIVLDETNSPLVGATVMAEGTTVGTVTNIEGDFTLVLPADIAANTISISYIGYMTEKVDISKQSQVRVILVTDLQQVGEVVVVAIGYGTMRKSDLTGAISSISSEDMKKGIISSTEQLLQGKIAGLTVTQGTGDPSSGATLRLRGGTSLSASNGPLIVVDGIPGVDINMIQPSEIVSVDILKDASAAAIYGSRGANGVIIVTTNREGKGLAAEYSSYVAFGNVANHLDLLSADQWRAYVRENDIVSAVDYGADTDWQGELEQTAITQSHTVSFSNGNEAGGYRASLNYLNNEGIIKRSKLERMGISLSSYRYALNDKLKLEAGFLGNLDTWNPVDNRIFERAYNLNPTIPVTNPDGSFTSIGGLKYENPVEINTNRENDNSRNRMLGYGKAELEIVQGLKATMNLSYEYNSMKGRLYKPTTAIMEGRTDEGYAQRTLGEYSNKQLETYLTYSKSFIEKHEINLLAGYSFLENVYEGFGAERRGFDTDLFLYNNLAAGQDFRAGDVYSYKGSARLISFFARTNYNYQGKYMVTTTLRRDGSSRFGVNNKWGLFPSASVAWRISDEEFMSWSGRWLNNLKLRLGYGVTGNQDGIGEYKSLSLLGAGGDSYYVAATDTWVQSYGPIQNPNPDLKWESTTQYNIGLDFTLINRINGTLELYQKNTSDLLYTYAVPQPPYLVGTMLANVGDLSNKGVELTLNAILLHNKDFSWDMNVTMAHNKQVIERLSNQVYETEEIYSGSLHNLAGMSNQFAQIIKEGYPVGTFWGPVLDSIGIDGNYYFKNDGEKEYLGDAQPDISLGLGTSFRYKMFDLQVSAYGMIGQKVLNATAMNLSDIGRLPVQNIPDAFLESGITDDPAYSSYWIEDASFLRLQTATLGYSMSMRKIGIERLRVYVTGENLFVITKYTGVDPEVRIEDNSDPTNPNDALSNPGIDMFNYYPKPRTFLLGLNLSF